MDITLLPILTIATYLLVSIYQFVLVKKQDSRHIQRVAALAMIPIILHGYLLHLKIDTTLGQNLSMLNIFSMVFWLIAIALVISSLLKKLEVLIMAVLPISAAVVLFATLSESQYIIDASSAGYLVHILIAITSVSVTGLAAIQSVFVTMLDNRLKAKPADFNEALPPLQDMERFLFFLIYLGFVLLTFTIVTAIIFMPVGSGGDMPLHKPILSTASWLVFGGFIIGRWRKGWRAKTAAAWTITGFILLFLGYFGTRAVLELILG